MEKYLNEARNTKKQLSDLMEKKFAEHLRELYKDCEHDRKLGNNEEDTDIFDDMAQNILYYQNYLQKLFLLNARLNNYSTIERDLAEADCDYDDANFCFPFNEDNFERYLDCLISDAI